MPMESNLLCLPQGQKRQMKIGKYSSKRLYQRATIQVPWVWDQKSTSFERFPEALANFAGKMQPGSKAGMRRFHWKNGDVEIQQGWGASLRESSSPGNNI
mmetsp:Transcript_8456/g.52875  ORF Transcript_8456/g.52875 Transcript_8456/m.52875 type:complete len:100 (+) Transcript_8456:46-345(+)